MTAVDLFEISAEFCVIVSLVNNVNPPIHNDATSTFTTQFDARLQTKRKFCFINKYFKSLNDLDSFAFQRNSARFSFDFFSILIVFSFNQI